MQTYSQPAGRRAVAAVLVAGLALALSPLAMPGVAHAESAGAYDFAAPPSSEANRVYGVDRRTGEMSACQFERPQGQPVGVTHCFARGAGAGPQKAGTYALVPTRYSGETGIFRVNQDTGEMSICYVREFVGAKGVLESEIMCTPPAK